jgi:hypothetical protein
MELVKSKYFLCDFKFTLDVAVEFVETECSVVYTHDGSILVTMVTIYQTIRRYIQGHSNIHSYRGENLTYYNTEYISVVNQ